MRAILSRFMQNKSGVTAIEYGLIAALISVAAIVAMTSVGGALSTQFDNITAKL